MTIIQLFYIKYIRGGGGASIKGQRYFAEIHISRRVLVPINRENRGVTVFDKCESQSKFTTKCGPLHEKRFSILD